MNRTACKPIRTSVPAVPASLLLSAVLVAGLPASPSLHAAERGAECRSLAVECGQRHVSQRRAGWLLGTDNLSQTYDRRAAMHTEVARACASGATTVRVEGVRTIAYAPRRAR